MFRPSQTRSPKFTSTTRATTAERLTLGAIVFLFAVLILPAATTADEALHGTGSQPRASPSRGPANHASRVRSQAAGLAGAKLDANGWPIFARQYNTRVIYISSSTGNDSNTGLSPEMAVATIAKGQSFLRNGYPDHLLLKAGDTFVGQSFGYVRVSGRSATAPMVIGTYGTGAAPIVETLTTGDAIGIGSLGGSGRGGDFLVVEGINFYAYERDPGNPAYKGPATNSFGTRFLNPVTELMIVGCQFRYYTTDVVIDASSTGPSSTVTLYRNVVTDAWGTDQHSQGVYMAGIAKPVIEQNIFDHNGWNASIPGASATIFNHNLYLQYTDGPVVFVGNISANSATDGVMARSGGTITSNLFIHDAMGPIVGITPGAESAAPLLTSASISGNIILQVTDIPASPSSLPRGQGVVVSNARGSGVQITDNIIANPDPSSSTVNQAGIRLDEYTKEINATNNVIYGFYRAVVDTGSANITSSNAINVADYNNPEVSIASYNASLGGAANVSAFLIEARKQSKSLWRVEYSAREVIEYIHGGFSVGEYPR
jgi:hypothetical protein